ncbi:MAG: hypothetical protein AAGN35_16910 [Bacteroidota bacterium]
MRIQSFLIVLLGFGALVGCRKVQLEPDPCDAGMYAAAKMRGACASETGQILDFWPWFGMRSEWNCDWIALVPQAYVSQGDPTLADTAWAAELELLIARAHAFGLKVMVKPHVDVNRSTVHRGLYELDSEAEWAEFARQYETWILTLAKVARDQEAEMFCVGTELRSFVAAEPVFWSDLIERVRMIFPGELTYAANWDEYGEMPFWDRLDYIGVDGYFPLVDAALPEVDDLVVAWEGDRRGLHNMQRNYCKPVLFTEMGYRSADYAAWEHWKMSNPRINLSAQANAWEAWFRVFWAEDWIAGAFVWDWRSNRIDSYNNEWTPQGKPAGEVIADWFGR